MTLETRPPTGKPNWPMVVLGGREKAGKTWAALLASSSQLVTRTFYVGIGEDDPDEYALIPGAKFEIVLHDGTYNGILRAIEDVAALPRGEKPHLMVVDSMTKLWDLIVDNAQGIANRRASGKKTASGDYSISPDLWNVAASQWKDVMDAIRRHWGPSILTARLDEVMVMENGVPTKAKQWKVQAHKSLVFDAGVLVEMHERGHALITGAKSARLQLEKPMDAPDFTIAELWKVLGITAETEMGERVHHGTVSDDPSVEAAVDAWSARAKEQTTKEGLTEVWQAARRAQVETPVLDAIRAIAAEFDAKQAESQETPPLDGVKPGKEKARDWLAEAEGKFADEVQGLFREATALGAPKTVLTDLVEKAGRAKQRPTVEAPAGEPWAPVADDKGQEEPEAAEPVSEGQAAVLADEPESDEEPI